MPSSSSTKFEVLCQQLRTVSEPCLLCADAVRVICKTTFLVNIAVGAYHHVEMLWMKTLPDELWQFQVFEREHHCSSAKCSGKERTTCVEFACFSVLSFCSPL
jgi:hypothetical protein